MIYLLTDATTKNKTIIVKDMRYLPFDDQYNISHENGKHFFMVNDSTFADIVTIPNDVSGTDDEVRIIVQHFFKNSMVKKFDSLDFFSAYLIYIMNN